VTAWTEDSARRLGGLDGGANVAGVEREGGRHLADSRDEDWDFVMDINAKGVFYCMREQLKFMLKNGGGSIVRFPVPLALSHFPAFSSEHMLTRW
jgi:NAD(P)-dependent dehydrogenase (short-subunit alcohol dehydrogenase family)